MAKRAEDDGMKIVSAENANELQAKGESNDDDEQLNKFRTEKRISNSSDSINIGSSPNQMSPQQNYDDDDYDAIVDGTRLVSLLSDVLLPRNCNELNRRTCILRLNILLP